MNGYTLANHFRQLRKSFPFSSLEADLYYELVGVGNDLGFPKHFQYSNLLLCATLGISEKSLIAARNRLKQAGLLDFVSGQKRSPTTYCLLAPGQKGLPKVSKIDSANGSKNGSVSGSVSDSPYKELKEREVKSTENNLPLTPSADASAAGVEKKSEVAFPPENPECEASHTEGGAVDVGTRKGRTPKLPVPPPELLPAACSLADLLNPPGDAHRVQQLAEPLSEAQAKRLLADYSEAAVRDILCQMANWQPLLKKATSANLTARNWLDKRAKESGAQARPVGMPAQGPAPAATSQVGKRLTVIEQTLADRRARRANP